MVLIGYFLYFSNSAFERGSINLPSETVSGSLNIAMKGLTMDELRERFIQRNAVTFDSEGISFFSQMGLLGIHVDLIFKLGI